MGLDVHCHLICGAVIDLEGEAFALYETVPYKCAQCPKNHQDGVKFCSGCGHRFMTIKSRRWAPKVLAYLRARGHRIDDDADADPYSLDGDPFYRVDSIQSSEDDRQNWTWAVGVEFSPVLSSNARQGRPVCFSQGILREATRTIEDALEDMGLERREVFLFPVMYLSV